MKTKAKQTRNISKKQKILMAIAGVMIALGGWWVYVSFMPHPLGDKLEYLGKRDGGCWVCDSKPYTSYFYATDMTPQQVADYFQGTAIADGKNLQPPTNQQAEGSYDIEFSLISPKDSSKPILVGYFSDGKKRIQDFKLSKSDKRHVVEIDSQYYNLAKDSL
jgi:hypothetical protein